MIPVSFLVIFGFVLGLYKIVRSEIELNKLRKENETLKDSNRSLTEAVISSNEITIGSTNGRTLI